MSKRDDQFKGFARALLTRIDNAIGAGYERIAHQEVTEQEFANELGIMIARAAYDLVAHAVSNLFEPEHVSEEIAVIPDLPVLPEEDE